MTIIVYHGIGTRSERITWLLKELGLAFDVVAMTLRDIIESSQFRMVAPLGRVPYFADGETRMIESLAIIEYLCETYDPDGRLWARPGEAERAAFLQWLHFSETIAIHFQNLNQQVNIIRPPEARSPVTVKLETRRLEKTLAMVENRLAERDYLLERGFTAADIAAAYSVNAARQFTSLEPFPHSTAWLARLAERPAAKAMFAAKI